MTFAISVQPFDFDGHCIAPNVARARGLKYKELSAVSYQWSALKGRNGETGKERIGKIVFYSPIPCLLDVRFSELKADC
jgi:hypothetical protein